MPSVRNAASVVLHRSDGRVFWVRRGEQLRFAGGFYAFPGGAVDLDNGDHLDATEAPSVAAAARELFEETGVLAVPGAERVPQAERKAVREWLLKGEASFAELLLRHGLKLDASQFLPAGRWVTPLAMPVRFDARFYLVELPPGEVAEVWPGELSDGGSCRPTRSRAMRPAPPCSTRRRGTR
jgi:ribonuclease/clavin/mitogillin